MLLVTILTPTTSIVLVMKGSLEMGCSVKVSSDLLSVRVKNVVPSLFQPLILVRQTMVIVQRINHVFLRDQAWYVPCFIILSVILFDIYLVLL